MQIRSRDPYSPIPLLTFSRSDWLLLIVATITTNVDFQLDSPKALETNSAYVTARIKQKCAFLTDSLGFETVSK